jgi:hypothetical protein
MLAETETMKASGVEKISLVLPSWVPTPHFLEQKLRELQRVAGLGDVELVKMFLQALVPTHKPGGNVPAQPVEVPVVSRDLTLAAREAARARQAASDEVRR